MDGEKGGKDDRKKAETSASWFSSPVYDDEENVNPFWIDTTKSSKPDAAEDDEGDSPIFRNADWDSFKKPAVVEDDEEGDSSLFSMNDWRRQAAVKDEESTSSWVPAVVDDEDSSNPSQRYEEKVDNFWLPDADEEDDSDVDGNEVETEIRSRIESVSLNDEEIVIVVVGNEAESKSRMADVLAELVGSPDPEVTASGLRIFSSKSRSLAVVDTLPMSGSQFQARGKLVSRIFKLDKRLWVTKNSLRRLLCGKLVFVVCVVTSTNQGKASPQDNGRETVSATFGIFKRQLKAVLVSVNKDDFIPETRASIRQLVAKNRHGFSRDNVNFVVSSRAGEALAKAIVEKEVLREGKGDKKILMPMRLEIQQTPSIRPKIGVWESERVILFGRAGSGKSTLAHMLTNGKAEAPEASFFTASSDNPNAAKSGEGRGWLVIDTTEFREPNGQETSVQSVEVQTTMKSFLQSVEGTYSHYLFVVEKNQMDSLDKILWKFIVELFAHTVAKIPSQFSVVISNANPEWLESEQISLKESFPGCTSFLCVDFPSVPENDERREIELESLRTESLKQFEEALAKLGRIDTPCGFYEFYKSSSSGLTLEERAARKVGKYANLAKAKLSGRPTSLDGLTNLLVQDENIRLLPGNGGPSVVPS